MTATARATSDQPTTPSDGLARFVTFLRWITTAIGVGWAAITPEQTIQVFAAAGLVIYSIYRSWRPLDWQQVGWRQPIAVLIELAIATTAVVATGTWTSTFIFALFVPVVAAGFARGQNYALLIAATAAAVLEIFSVALGDPSGAREVITWTGELFLVAVVASYGRTLLTRAEQAVVIGELQAQKLAQANALLADLDRLAKDLSVSFDFQDATRTAMVRMRNEVPFDVGVLLLSIDGTDLWDIALAEGIPLANTLGTEQLPRDLQNEANGVRSLSGSDTGFDPESSDGLYAPLLVGNRTIGFIAVERTHARFSDTDRTNVELLARQIALSVDNARWFERLQARGAARERIRLARDLHDRLGQGVAYVAFELDRLAQRAQVESVHEELTVLRDEARSTVRELRETLSDLRTDVAEDVPLVSVMKQFLERVEVRSGTETLLEAKSDKRINLGQEQEIWRVAQEAITNAERHADATKIVVRWSVSDEVACLEIEDDGVGFVGQPQASSLGRPSYGITGMRERASLLGGALEITAVEPHGTKVQLRVSNTAYASKAADYKTGQK